MKNLGTSDALYNFGTVAAPATVTPGLMPQIASIYRIAPALAVNISKVRLVAEYEITSARYGLGTISTGDGLYKSSVDATNQRIQLMLVYLF